MGLPPKEAFHNDLTLKDISDDDYQFAQQMWKTFKLKNLGQLHDLYCEANVALLADIFENSRKFSLANYKLDPAHFSTAPGLSWSAALKYTKVKLELFTDPDINLFIDNGVIGGISLISNHYAKANSPGLPDYNPNEPNSYLMLLDCNNQYGWAMSEYLPYSGFEWLEVPPVENWESKILGMKDQADKGFFFEVDLDYPEELHDLHDTYPLAPEHVKVNDGMLSTYQQQLAEDLGVKIGGDKLCLTLSPKTKYICHYRNLKQYIELGLKITKVHRILKFNQGPWLKEYIDLNKSLRKQANSKFEQDFAKLMNNSFFGKTCEDVRNYKNLKIVNDPEKAQKQINKPNMTQFKIYHENLAAIQLRQTKVKLVKPRYIGMTILNLSKIVMYDFHYKFILPKYPGTKLMFTDTDSFCYYIPTEQNIYEDIKGNDWIDFSNYSRDHPDFSNKFKPIPGKFKDEMGSKLITEFVGLRAKMYSILKENRQSKATCKGVNTAVKNEVLRHQDYKNTLFNSEIKVDKMMRIMQDEHNLFTACTTKTSLSPFNDKKWITREGNEFTSYSFGHYKLDEELVNLLTVENDCCI